MALSIAYMSDDDIPAQQLIHELGKAGYSLLELFEFLLAAPGIDAMKIRESYGRRFAFSASRQMKKAWRQQPD